MPTTTAPAASSSTAPKARAPPRLPNSQIRTTKSEDEQVWMRLVGLPFSATESDVLDFFSGFVIAGLDQIVFSPTRNGRGPDRAYVRMIDENEARRAEVLNGRMMKGRYIEARRIALRHVLREVKMGVNALKSTAGANHHELSGNLPMVMIQSVTLVGIPFNCVPHDIFTFLTGLRVRGIHICGHRNDKCIVELQDVVEAMRAVKRLHRRYLGDRYIEVYAARPCDMQCSCHPTCVLVPFHLIPPTASDANATTAADEHPKTFYNPQQPVYGAIPGNGETPSSLKQRNSLQTASSAASNNDENGSPTVQADLSLQDSNRQSTTFSSLGEYCPSVSSEKADSDGSDPSGQRFVHNPYHFTGVGVVEEDDDRPTRAGGSDNEATASTLHNTQNGKSNMVANLPYPTTFPRARSMSCGSHPCEIQRPCYSSGF